MEKALYQEKTIYASNIKESYELEKIIREASTRGELRCLDKNCDSPVLKYCHGNKKRPYFAHRNATVCDYDEYDKSNSAAVNDIKTLIFNHLAQLGITADIDKKFFEHHYVHLAVFHDNCWFAVELTQDKATTRKTNRLYNQYKASNISVQFLVVGNDVTLQDESESNFIRRFSLNESANNTLLVIDEEGSELYQYRLDLFKYTYCGAQLPNYPSIYSEKAKFENLSFENGSLTISGFENRYKNWYEEKQNRYNKFLIPVRKKVYDTESPKEFSANTNKHLDIAETEIETVSKRQEETYETNEIKNTSELNFIETISLPEDSSFVELYNWSEDDFLKFLKRICYKSDGVAFRNMIVKMKNPNEEEKEIINRLWQKFKETRPDYFYILKSAYNKSKN